MYSWIGRQEPLRKNQFANKLRWLRTFRNHRWKGLEKVHPVQVCLFCTVIFCGVVLWQIFNNGFIKKAHLGGMRLAESFQTAVSDPS